MAVLLLAALGLAASCAATGEISVSLVQGNLHVHGRGKQRPHKTPLLEHISPFWLEVVQPTEQQEICVKALKSPYIFTKPVELETNMQGLLTAPNWWLVKNNITDRLFQILHLRGEPPSVKKWAFMMLHKIALSDNQRSAVTDFGGENQGIAFLLESIDGFKSHEAMGHEGLSVYFAIVGALRNVLLRDDTGARTAVAMEHGLVDRVGHIITSEGDSRQTIDMSCSVLATALDNDPSLVQTMREANIPTITTKALAKFSGGDKSPVPLEYLHGVTMEEAYPVEASCGTVLKYFAD